MDAIDRYGTFAFNPWTSALTFGTLALVVLRATMGGVPMPLEDDPVSVAQFRVVTDAKPWEKATPEARRAAERETIETILARYGPEPRERLRALLEGTDLPPGSQMSISSTADPELSRLLGVLGSIRWAEYQSRVAAIKPEEDPGPTVQVQLALVPALARPDARVTILRRPGDQGRVLALMREDLTIADVELGLNAASLSFKRFGPDVQKERTLHLGTARAPQNPTVKQSFIDELKAAKPRHVEGVGTVRTTVVVTPIDRASRRMSRTPLPDRPPRRR